MISLKDIQTLFFLGIGGIGMSALARYFHRLGCAVSGYDRTPSVLTKELEQEGIKIIYDDDPKLFGISVCSRQNLVIVRTPAVPEDSALYTYFREQNLPICKRSELLGLVTRSMKALCVAGTHGKTTTSTMLAHLLNENGDLQEPKGVNAFLGGISMNYSTNVLIDPQSDLVVVEADEYDRSFHRLTPYISVVTAVDADHLDIYGTPEAYRDAFAHYTSLITNALVMKHGLDLQPRLQPGVKCYTYDVQTPAHPANGADFYADHIRVGEGRIVFDLVTPATVVKDIRLGVPVWVNIENAVAAMTVALLSGVPAEHLRARMASFKGVQRRFNIHVHTPKVVYIDDYAHHPQEIATAIDSIRKLFPERRLVGVFQPHLFTRTRDFAPEFKRVLHTMDELILLPIYPAREEPIEGVTSEMLGGQVVEKADLVAVLKEKVQQSQEPLVILTVGAGDIDRLVQPIAEQLASLQ